MTQEIRQKYVYIATFGCQMNKYDSLYLANLLDIYGYTLVDNLKNASLILLNTCSVRKRVEHKIYSYLGTLRTFKQRCPSLIIGVGGCLAQQEGSRLLEKLPYLDLVFGPQSLARVPELIKEVRHGRRQVSLTSIESQSPSFVLPYSYASEVKAIVKIITGCNNFCSYCIVPYVRGREHSRSSSEIVKEVEGLVAAGVREVTLVGQNVNSYYDPEHGQDFATLLKILSKLPNLLRLRFTTNHPKDLSPAIIENIASLDNVMEQLHLPAQSGSDQILQAMQRGYTRRQYLKQVTELRQRIPKLSLGGDIIVGFPGETDEHFYETLSFLREVNYDFLFSFKYSDRPFTKASYLPNKLSQAVKSYRLQQLQDLQGEISLARHKMMVGTEVQVLVEGLAKRGQGMMTGRDRGGRVINFEGEEKFKGKLVRIRIREGLANSLKGYFLGLA